MHHNENEKFAKCSSKIEYPSHQLRMLCRSVSRILIACHGRSLPAYLSISEIYLVRNRLWVNSSSDPSPRNSSLCAVNSHRTWRTISPMYIPEIIFSNLTRNSQEGLSYIPHSIFSIFFCVRIYLKHAKTFIKHFCDLYSLCSVYLTNYTTTPMVNYLLGQSCASFLPENLAFTSRHRPWWRSKFNAISNSTNVCYKIMKISRATHSWWPGFSECLSTSLSKAFLMKSRTPLSPKAPHSVFTTTWWY